mmetsp:Transcript_11464/g.21673  ORF Transcript_11464/g.21673 Transcript_11464/m.21673 type:complete len:270 (+) Transcript_11464:59-868(+)
MGLSTSVLPWEPNEWPVAMATSPIFSPKNYLVFRGLFTMIFAINFLGHAYEVIVTRSEGWFYFAYLTNWSLVVQMISELLLLFSACYGYRRLETTDEGARTPMPTLIRIALVFWSISIPVSLLVALMYWTLLRPVWELEVDEIPDYWTIFAHGINWILLTGSVFCGRLPYSVWKGGWTLLYGVVYVVWTVIHFFAKIGTPRPCVEYPQNECPLYDVVDWHFPLDTLLVGAGIVFVAVPIAVSFTVFLVTLRDCCDKGSKRNETGKPGKI